MDVEWPTPIPSVLFSFVKVFSLIHHPVISPATTSLFSFVARRTPHGVSLSPVHYRGATKVLPPPVLRHGNLAIDFTLICTPSLHDLPRQAQASQFLLPCDVFDTRITYTMLLALIMTGRKTISGSRTGEELEAALMPMLSQDDVHTQRILGLIDPYRLSPKR